MAEEKEKTLREALASGDEARRLIDIFAKQGEQTQKILEDIAKRDTSLREAMRAALGVKHAAEIAESMKELEEAVQLAKEGKLGEVSDETPVRELMQRMKHLKEAQKLALETGKPDLTVANAWLDSHWPSPRLCPICKHDEWGIGPTFAQIPTSAFGHNMPPRVNPCVAVVCGHCGNTVLLNAIVMGLVPSPKSED